MPTPTLLPGVPPEFEGALPTSLTAWPEAVVFLGKRTLPPESNPRPMHCQFTENKVPFGLTMILAPTTPPEGLRYWQTAKLPSGRVLCPVDGNLVYSQRTGDPRQSKDPDWDVSIAIAWPPQKANQQIVLRQVGYKLLLEELGRRRAPLTPTALGWAAALSLPASSSPDGFPAAMAAVVQTLLDRAAARGLPADWRAALAHPAWAKTPLAPLGAWARQQELESALPSPVPSARRSRL